MARTYTYEADTVNGDGRSAGQLFQELAHETQSLFGLEMELAKAEISTNLSQMGKDASFLAVGGAVIYAGLLAIMLAAIIALANIIPAWLSALVVGVVVALIGYLVLRRGLNDLKHRSPVPRQTIDTLKQDKAMLQEEVS